MGMVILFPFFVYICKIKLKIIIMSKIETNKFTKGVIDAINYYFEDDKTDRMTKEEYDEFLNDIKKAYFHLNELKEHYNVKL